MPHKRSEAARSPKPEDYFLEVLKIVNGALSGDRAKVVTYAELLAQKLEIAGADRTAARLRQSLEGHVAATKLANAESSDFDRLPVDSESRLPLADVEILAPGASEVFLEAETNQRLTEFLRNTRSASQLLAHGVGIAPSLLIYGPPGCGKTEIARFISAQLSLPLLTARSDSLISSFLGSTAKNVRHLFESAMRRPCVLFLDEFDALAKKRDDHNELGELKRVVISLLQNIDSLDGKTIIVAATNHQHLLDPAVWRRFSYRLEVTLPTLNVRRGLFTHFLRTFSPAESIDSLAFASDGLTGADIKEISEDSIRHAIFGGEATASLDSLLRGVLRHRLGQAFSFSPTAENLKKVRSLSQEVFSYRRLSSIFGIALGSVGHLLAEQ